MPFYKLQKAHPRAQHIDEIVLAKDEHGNSTSISTSVAREIEHDLIAGASRLVHMLGYKIIESENTDSQAGSESSSAIAGNTQGFTFQSGQDDSDPDHTDDEENPNS